MAIKHLALPLVGCRAAILAAALSLGLGPQAPALAQQDEAATASKGENFSAKPPAQLFQSDCTGSGCHSKPQGLAKSAGLGLAGFLREHYTNSRESAAALANYLQKLPSGPEPKERESRSSRPGRGAPASSERAGFSPGEPGSGRTEPREARTPKPATRASRTPTPARHEEEGKEKPVTATAHNHPAAAEPGEKEKAAPTGRPAQRGHAATAAATGSTAAPAAAPEPEPAATPKVEAPPAPAAAAPPKAKQFDIFD